MITVIQSCPVWLPRTQNWIHGQMEALPDDIRSVVVCRETENLDDYPARDLHVLPRLYEARSYGPAGLLMHAVDWWVQRRWKYQVSRREGASLLHSHFGATGSRDAPLARKLNLKHFVTFYGVDLPVSNVIERARRLRLFRSVDRVLCEGPHMARTIEAQGCPPEKIRVHRLGVDLTALPFRPRVHDPLRAVKILIAGRFCEKKGIPDALAAAARLRRNYPVQVTVIGDATDDEPSRKEKQRILIAAQRGAFGDDIRFVGFLPHAQMLGIANEHDVFLSPSITASDGDTEGGAPVAIIEMAATGMLVVSTTHCDIPGVIRHQETGLLAAEHDVAGLVRSLEWLIANPGAWTPMAVAARQHVEAGFDVVKQGAELGRMYRAAVQGET